MLGAGVVERGEADLVDEDEVGFEDLFDDPSDAVVDESAVEGLDQLGGGEVSSAAGGGLGVAIKKTAARKGGSGAGGAGGVRIALIEIGDRVAVEAVKVGREPRAGVVTHVAGAMIGVRWDDGNVSSFIPASGSLRVVGRAGERVNERP